MECFERGIIDKKQTNGVELNFGNYEAALDLIESIAYREGIGDILAEGVHNAAKAFGQDSEDFAMQVDVYKRQLVDFNGSPLFLKNPGHD